MCSNMALKLVIIKQEIIVWEINFQWYNNYLNKFVNKIAYRFSNIRKSYKFNLLQMDFNYIKKIYATD